MEKFGVVGQPHSSKPGEKTADVMKQLERKGRLSEADLMQIVISAKTSI